ncbi:hypothetical protein SLEP1_g47541 [Rubroshorea leprosula]|uniref:DM2 domain-containing protein n=1 Tax=Rubroshorea leprosula TaxID=152421 RepID=A0AAV5LRP9_9ROSI|nr:hypothetical protein SLEP1_g47541 [Rubroshorea leprosula]
MVRPLAFSRSLLFPLPWARFLEPMKPLAVMQSSRSGPTSIKTHDLQNPNDKREIFCDEKLKALFGGKEKVGFLEIGKLLAQHFVKTN